MYAAPLIIESEVFAGVRYRLRTVSPGSARSAGR
jgi:hypothetical protein